MTLTDLHSTLARPHRTARGKVSTITRRQRADEFVHASWIVKAVTSWAGPDYFVLTESVASVVGRIDILLVPIGLQTADMKRQRGHWADKRRLVGVEVKANRQDFQRGLREGQFERYAETLGALYIATPRSIKTDEIPPGLGHFVVYRPPESRDWRCLCRRHATYRDYTIDKEPWWRLIHVLAKQVREEVIARQLRQQTTDERLGDRFRTLYAKAIAALRTEAAMEASPDRADAAVREGGGAA